ncbi:hypothetical protein LTR66_005205 [Elasticomyces elasticus]|nr:hypothetical protein LTR50_006968 [Elasticomyces elasticus]KAK4994855.1 hypothetical protein LTR66_005205 [Elasticomyces elasticus]
MPLPPGVNADLDVFRQQYFQLLDPETLQWPGAEMLRVPHVQQLIYDEMFNERNLQFPPPLRYRMRVLKRLIAKIESSVVDPEEDDISDDLMNALSILVTAPLPSEASSAHEKSYVTYHCSPVTQQTQRTVTLLESRAIISSSGSTGLRTWEAALCLGRYLSSPAGKPCVKQKNIIELGAGTGYVSILCAKHLQSKHVTATDGDQGVVEALESNAFINGLQGSSKLTASVLRWGRSLKGSWVGDENANYPFDIVVGADIVSSDH